MEARAGAHVKGTQWVRQIHRWMSIVFTLAVMLNFAVWGQEEIGLWVGSLTLLPLIVLLLTGLYLFALPYLAKWRGHQEIT